MYVASPPTPGAIVCVIVYAFGRGLTVGAGCIRVTMWEDVEMCMCVRASDLVCVYGYVVRVFVGVFVYGYVCAIGGICQRLARLPCCCM